MMPTTLARIAVLVAAIGCDQGKRNASPEPPPAPPPPAPAPTPDAAAPEPTPDARVVVEPPPPPPDPKQPVTCSSDADCPRIVCGPCSKGAVVTVDHAYRECVVNPCPKATAMCRSGTCVVR